MSRLLLVLAHPDDESMGCGGLVARHCRAGVEVHLLCATRGGAGWNGRPAGRRPEELADIRSIELECAAKVYGLESVELWDYPDGGVPGCDQDEITTRIREHVERVKPEVVIGWGPGGGYGHPDHIAIGACTDRALAQMAIPHYHFATNEAVVEGFRALMKLDGHDPAEVHMETFDRVSAILELSPEELDIKLRAIACHDSQLSKGWLQLFRDADLQRGLALESYVRVGDPAPADLRLTTELLPEFG